MKITVADLCEVFENGWARGVADGRREMEQRVTESTRALVTENGKLKGDLEVLELKLHVKDQKDSFPEVRKEQTRIARGIRSRLVDKPDEANDLLFWLALGDIQ